MKIGILTIPPHTNFGGILQSYALQTVLERMGHEVWIIDRDPFWHLSWQKKMICYPKRILQHYLLGKKNIKVFTEDYERKVRPIIRQHTDKFINKYLHMLPIENYEDLSENKFFDAYVVGSDQVWRPSYMPQIENAFIAFDKRDNLPIIAYAASFGVDTWEYNPEQTEICKELVKRFCFVSVREDSGRDLCKNYLGVDAKWVLDPTMLLSVDDYKQLVDNSDMPKCAGNLMVYILDQTSATTAVIDKLVQEKSLKPFVKNGKVDNFHAPLEQRIQPPVESWLRGFMDSEIIITDSFHACVFSILFHKQFLVVCNKKRGLSRFKSLLRMFGLESHIVSDVEKISYHQMPTTNWRKVDEILANKRKEAMDIISHFF